MTVVSFTPDIKSLSIDSNEQYICFGSYSNPINVVRISASTGVIIDAQRHLILDGQSHDIMIHQISDNSGYYVTGQDSSSTYIFQFAVELTTGRLVLGGVISSIGYSSKFMVQSIPAHPDFQIASSITMNVLVSGTNDITADSGQAVGTVTPQSVTAQTYTNKTVTFVSGTSYMSDVNYQTGDQSYSILESISLQITTDLP